MNDSNAIDSTLADLKNLENKIFELEAKNESLSRGIKDLLISKDSLRYLLEDIHKENLDYMIKICEQEAEIRKLRASLRESKK